MYYVAELFDFFDELAVNNDRVWFAANKHRYDHLRALWLDDVDKMISFMAQWDGRLASASAKRAAYRIYRDTRFSLDKTPYKTHFACALFPSGKRDVGAGYYLQLGQGKMEGQGLYSGIWCPPSPQLAKLRRAIVDNIEEFSEIISDPELTHYFPDWVGDTLKTIPKGYDRNHPQAELLRRKDFGREDPVDRSFFLNPEWPRESAKIFEKAARLVEFINYSLFEEDDSMI